jgi:hypothetical protein
MLSGYSIPLNFVFASDSYDILGNSHSSCCNRNHTGIDADGASYLPGQYLKVGTKIWHNRQSIQYIRFTNQSRKITLA